MTGFAKQTALFHGHSYICIQAGRKGGEQKRNQILLRLAVNGGRLLFIRLPLSEIHTMVGAWVYIK